MWGSFFSALSSPRLLLSCQPRPPLSLIISSTPPRQIFHLSHQLGVELISVTGVIIRPFAMRQNTGTQTHSNQLANTHQRQKVCELLKNNKTNLVFIFMLHLVRL